MHGLRHGLIYDLWRLRHPGRLDHDDIRRCEMARISLLAVIAF
jgi:hypothetical protein